MEQFADLNVLVIDDEVNVVNAIRRALRNEPYCVEGATDPLKGLELAKSLDPSIVICDMRMPGLSGVEVFSELSRTNPRCVRILLTGYADISSTIAAINQGHIDLYMTKPWNDEELIVKLQQQLRLVSIKNERDQLAGQLARKVKELSQLNVELDQRVQSRTQELHQTNLFLEQAFSELNLQFLNAIKVFSNLLEMTSPEMSGHHHRVAELARLIAIEMNMSEIEVRDIHIAGLLHDIGKLGVAQGDWGKSFASLDSTARVTLMKHPLKGQSALLALPELTSASTIIRQHHERVDGLGYPDGLTDSEISRGAKVLAVAEDWDELQLGWLMERKLSATDAFDFIVQGAGKRYDPDVLAVLPVALQKMEASPKDDEEIVDGFNLIPGMILSRDLHNQDGVLLSAKGTPVSTKLIQFVRGLPDKHLQCIKAYCQIKPQKLQT